jgi:hypothetical protein
MTNEISIPPSEATAIFLDRLINRAYDGAIRIVNKLLEQGPPGRKKAPAKMILHQWFQGLNSQDQEHVKAVIRETAYSAVFGCLVLLDNKTGGYPVKGKISDFSLCLQIYESDEAQGAYSPQTSIRLNLSYTDDDLHDLFQIILSERTGDVGEFFVPPPPASTSLDF